MTGLKVGESHWNNIGQLNFFGLFVNFAESI